MNDYRTILITGGAGFVGSNLAVLFKTKFPGWRVVCLDNLKRRGSEKNLNKLKEYKIDFFHGDIRNPEDLSFNFPINLLLDCAAEPAVLASLQNDPRYVINTNLLGTVNCLQLAVKHQADIIFISTSRVYPYDILNGLPTGENDMRCYWEGNRQTTSKNGWLGSRKGRRYDVYNQWSQVPVWRYETMLRDTFTRVSRHLRPTHRNQPVWHYRRTRAIWESRPRHLYVLVDGALLWIAVVLYRLWWKRKTGSRSASHC